MNKDIKVKDNKQKPKDACPAGTEADSELQPKLTTFSPACSNTFVVRSPYSVVIYNVGLCPTAECCLCVGTRQALLQGWLLCVGFVCLANVPDLVCRLI